MTKARYCWSMLLIVTAILFVLVKNVASQSNGIEQAKDMSYRAQGLVQERQWAEAIEVLSVGFEKYTNQEEKKEYGAILNFSMGYVYQRMSDEEPGERISNLELAAKFYRQTLVDAPGNVQVMDNLTLVLKSLGQWQEAVGLLRRAAEISPQKRGAYLLTLGDLYRENDSLPRALECYRQASELNPSHETPHWRILNLYQGLPDEVLRELLRYSKHLAEINHPELAKAGFAQVINRSFRLNVALAEEALIYWAELMATQGWILEQSLQYLPAVAEWPSAAIRELGSLVKEPETAGSHLEWWQTGDLRRHVAAFTMKAVGKNFLLKGDFTRSAAVYELALHIAPSFSRYGGSKLEKKPIIALDIGLELANLYHRYPSLDPMNEKFPDLITKLFNEKTMAYAEKDLSAVQRYHTILGLIYAERRQWTSPWRPGNAIFQLEHALRTAQKRARRNPKDLQTLPHLQSLLAKGYAETGKDKEACRTYVNATMGYLDLDGLAKAEQALELAAAFPAAAITGNTQKLKELNYILDSRQEIPQLKASNLDSNKASNLDSNSVQYYRKFPEYHWLFDPDNIALDKSFVDRQRFKAFADLASHSSELHAWGESSFLRTQAAGLATTVGNTLTSTDDVLRLKRMDTSFAHLYGP